MVQDKIRIILKYVAPLTGAWIEITGKPQGHNKLFVAPLTGAWIEIAMAEEDAIKEAVAPLTGAWIEIIFKPAVNLALFPSLPSRERGLKFKIHQTTRDLVN